MKKKWIRKWSVFLLAGMLAFFVTACGSRRVVSDSRSEISEDEGQREDSAKQGTEAQQEAGQQDSGTVDQGEIMGQTAGENSWQQFFRKSFYHVWSDAGNENRIYSPVNLYLCLAMLSEISAGNTRTQITDLLGQEDQKKIRRQSEELYRETNHVLTCRVGELDAEYDYMCSLGNSLWLQEGFPFQEKQIGRLEKFYYAECHQGKMGTPDIDKQIQQWVNHMTGGKLKKQAESINTDPNTVMMMLSSINFESAWKNHFSKKKTKQGIFHGLCATGENASGKAQTEDVTCDFLHQTIDTEVMKEDWYTAVKLPMQNGVSMYVVLPDEGISLADLLELVKAEGEDLLSFCAGYNKDAESVNVAEYASVDVSIPKFRLDSSFELEETLKNMGVVDMFQEKEADFSSLINRDSDGKAAGIYVGKARQASNMSVDENGCSVASYTELSLESKGLSPKKQYKINCDRPFLFFITKEETKGNGGTPLFTGVIQNLKNCGAE